MKIEVRGSKDVKLDLSKLHLEACWTLAITDEAFRLEITDCGAHLTHVRKSRSQRLLDIRRALTSPTGKKHLIKPATFLYKNDNYVPGKVVKVLALVLHSRSCSLPLWRLRL